MNLMWFAMFRDPRSDTTLVLASGRIAEFGDVLASYVVAATPVRYDNADWFAFGRTLIHRAINTFVARYSYEQLPLLARMYCEIRFR